MLTTKAILINKKNGKTKKRRYNGILTEKQILKKLKKEKRLNFIIKEIMYF